MEHHPTGNRLNAGELRARAPVPIQDTSARVASMITTTKWGNQYSEHLGHFAKGHAACEKLLWHLSDSS